MCIVVPIAVPVLEALKVVETHLTSELSKLTGLKTVVTRMDTPRSDCHLHLKYIIGVFLQ